MITTQQIIHCTNPDCAHPINVYGSLICANCQTPITYRYLWAVGDDASKIAVGEIVENRYEVIAPKIWFDTKPGELPEIPEIIPPEISPFLRLYEMRTHLPLVYGFVNFIPETTSRILLLENIPVDIKGQLAKTMTEVWEQATPVRQVHWLWQIVNLWQPLSELGMVASLLSPNNLRVQGWCVRLLEFLTTPNVTSLRDLGEFWEPLVPKSHSSISEQLENIVQQLLRGNAKIEDITKQLNLLLLSSAAELPLSLKVSGATDTGIELEQNEDSCFPTSSDSIDDPLLPRVSIVCDGIGGHEGGEVASQLAVSSMKLQIRALLTEVALATEPVPPELLKQQLEASLRVVNNLICSANNQQNREGLQRMGTTLVMAVQIPQPVQTNMGWDAENSHEVYIASVGDSRAYWITRDSCICLTVDDDIVAREVRLARSSYRKALQRADATALTQALGTKEADNLRIEVQRLIIDEDGLLVLCSDGLSDGNLVERTWRDLAIPVLDGQTTLEETLYIWIRLANQTNGNDNISLVLTHCRVSPEYIVTTSSSSANQTPLDIFETNIEVEQEPETNESEMAESSQALLDLELSEEAVIPPTPTVKESTPKPQRQRKPLALLIGLLLLLLGSTSLGLFVWWRYSPRTFGQMCRQLPHSLERICP